MFMELYTVIFRVTITSLLLVLKVLPFIMERVCLLTPSPTFPPSCLQEGV